ncbi:MAG: hypothetical protein AAGB24_04210 [Bacteroidota bacterium]
MKKMMVPFFFLAIVSISCKNKAAQTSKIALAKEYYAVLNTSDHSRIPLILADSIITKEIDYSMRYSQADYVEFLKWDAVFEPEYSILDIKQVNGTVEAKVSKKDQRILFLHEAPTVTHEVIRFAGNKITHVEINAYVIFDDTIFSKNREMLLDWVDKHHPELNGFLYDQTEQGGLNYLKAIKLYNTANQ